MSRFAKIIIGVSIIFLSACSVHYANPSKSAFVLDSVPFFPQEDFQCGPASLASVLNYHGISVQPSEVASAIYSKSARGTLTIDMILYSQKQGLKADQYSGSIDDLKNKLKNGYPLIVMSDFGFSAIQMNHFMVVTGYNDEGVVVNSGKSRSVLITYSNFASSWNRTKNWTLWIRK